MGDIADCGPSTVKNCLYCPDGGPMGESGGAVAARRRRGLIRGSALVDEVVDVVVFPGLGLGVGGNSVKEGDFPRQGEVATRLGRGRSGDGGF